MTEAVANVLLIEDNPGDARLVREHLDERFGPQCRLHVATSLAEGRSWLDRHSPDVILLDLQLPDSEGLDTYFAVHALAPHTPIVVLSGHDDAQIALHAVHAGAEDYLAKQEADAASLARSMRHAVERRRVNRTLRESEAKYRAIVETAEEGILQVDGDGVVRFANTRMGQLLDRRAEDLVGVPLSELVESTDPALVDGLARRVREAGGGRNVFPARLRGAPAESSVLLAAGSLRAHGSATADLVILVTDVSGHQLAKDEIAALGADLERRVSDRTAQLESFNADLVLFNQAVAHDLRGPLSAIAGIASLLEQDEAPRLSDEGVANLRHIQRRAHSMNELVDGLLRLAHIGRQEPVSAPIDLSAMSRGLLTDLALAQPGRTVDVHVDPDLVGWGDPALLHDLMQNLLSNAWKYTGRAARPRITVRGQDLADGTRAIVVSDNGVGFDARAAADLFQPFTRLPSSRGFPGSGIGLAIARRIVEKHGGRIQAESEPGIETRFLFTLGAA